MSKLATIKLRIRCFFFGSGRQLAIVACVMVRHALLAQRGVIMIREHAGHPGP